MIYLDYLSRSVRRPAKPELKNFYNIHPNLQLYDKLFVLSYLFSLTETCGPPIDHLFKLFIQPN